MDSRRPRYLSFLIRLWQVKMRGGWQWRASLESPGSGKKQSFPSLEHLIAFLRAQANNQRLDDVNAESDE
jgi:hypothetical protein